MIKYSIFLNINLIQFEVKYKGGGSEKVNIHVN